MLITLLLLSILSPASSADTNAWPQSGGTSAHTQRGVSLGPSDATVLSKWNATFSGAFTSTIVSGNSGGLERVFAVNSMSLMAMYGANGSLAWTQLVSGSGSVKSSPCLAPNPTLSSPDLVVVLTAAPPSTGVYIYDSVAGTLWKSLSLSSCISTTPPVADSIFNVFVGCTGGSVSRIVLSGAAPSVSTYTGLTSLYDIGSLAMGTNPPFLYAGDILGTLYALAISSSSLSQQWVFSYASATASVSPPDYLSLNSSIVVCPSPSGGYDFLFLPYTSTNIYAASRVYGLLSSPISSPTATSSSYLPLDTSVLGTLSLSVVCSNAASANPVVIASGSNAVRMETYYPTCTSDGPGGCIFKAPVEYSWGDSKLGSLIAPPILDVTGTTAYLSLNNSLSAVSLSTNSPSKLWLFSPLKLGYFLTSPLSLSQSGYLLTGASDSRVWAVGRAGTATPSTTASPSYSASVLPTPTGAASSSILTSASSSPSAAFSPSITVTVSRSAGSSASLASTVSASPCSSASTTTAPSVSPSSAASASLAASFTSSLSNSPVTTFSLSISGTWTAYASASVPPTSTPSAIQSSSGSPSGSATSTPTPTRTPSMTNWPTCPPCPSPLAAAAAAPGSGNANEIYNAGIAMIVIGVLLSLFALWATHHFNPQLTALVCGGGGRGNKKQHPRRPSVTQAQGGGGGGAAGRSPRGEAAAMGGFGGGQAPTQSPFTLREIGRAHV